MTQVCISCKRNTASLGGVVRFMCPQCSKYEIIRCGDCRAKASKYKCPNCGFEGPN